MSNEVKKGKTFIKEVIARLKGDDAEVKAAKISRKAISAVEGQLAALNSKKVDLENTVEDAAEFLNNAKYPIELISDNQSYIRGIEKAQKAYDEAVENLENVEQSIAYFTELLEKF